MSENTISIDPTALRHGVDALIRTVAETVVLPRFRNLTDADVRTKTGPGDLVTAADEEAEQLLAEGLTQLWPGSLIIGEEAAARDPSVLALLAQPEPVWVIDPIDGTANFVDGKAVFAVVLALIENGETTTAWIHDPIKGRTLWAATGKGTWVDGIRLDVDERLEVDLSVMSASLYHRAFKPARSAFANIRRSGSAAHEYWALAENRLQISSFTRLKPWDHAAGVLIHSEAGGYSRMLDGMPYNPANNEKRGLLSAPSKSVWEKVRALADEQYV